MGFFVLASSGFASAQMNISPQMLEQFKQLPPAQQQQLARQYGIDPRTLQQMMQGGGSSTNQSIDNQSQLSQPMPMVEEEEDLNALPSYELVRRLEELQEKEKAIEDKTLKRFGYDLFEQANSAMLTPGDIPVPTDYVLGPGDVVEVQMYGKDNQEYSLQVNREGQVVFPQLGPISVAGLSFTEARAVIAKRVKQQIIGVEALVTLGELKSIRIFIAGDANKPGAYTVSSLSTITQALFVAGGINDIGSLRNIQLKRRGQLVTEFDLYDLLVRGDASNDARLHSGDVVFIPPVGKLVSVGGEVRRPAIYELKGKETFADAIAVAGGLTAGAYPKSSSVERYNPGSLKSVISVDFTSDTAKRQLARDGDVIRVQSASSRYDNAITLVGAVTRPGHYQWYPGLRVNGIIPSLWDDLAVSADLDYAIVLRQINDRGDIEVHQVNLGDAITKPNSVSNIELRARDKLMVFNYSDATLARNELNKLVQFRLDEHEAISSNPLLTSDMFNVGFNELQENRLTERRELGGVSLSDEEQAQQDEADLLKNQVSKMLFNLFNDEELIALSGNLSRKELLFPVLAKIQSQSRHGQPVQLVAITGQVKHEGVYPLAVNSKVSDLLVAAGGLEESAYVVRSELTRLNDNSEGSSISHQGLDLTLAMIGDEQHNIQLKSRDKLSVLTVPDWQQTSTVEIRGEVKFPGVYNINRGETLKDVIERAGGFTRFSYLPGAVFVRESVRKQEQLEISKLADQLRRDVATRGVSQEGNWVSFADAQSMIEELENLEAVGRLVVDVDAISGGLESANLQLENGDVLYVPTTQETIAVMGEVQHATTHRYTPGLSVEDYLLRSGGPKERADEKRLYVIRANGEVFLPKRSFWFGNQSQELQAGDTIIMPLDTAYKDNMTLWTQVTTIIYNSAVALATIARL
ncbi:SLBB domain-containing protein [Paraferrimonas sedimenticola]